MTSVCVCGGGTYISLTAKAQLQFWFLPKHIWNYKILLHRDVDMQASDYFVVAAKSSLKSLVRYLMFHLICLIKDWKKKSSGKEYYISVI